MDHVHHLAHRQRVADDPLVAARVVKLRQSLRRFRIVILVEEMKHFGKGILIARGIFENTINEPSIRRECRRRDAEPR